MRNSMIATFYRIETNNAQWIISGDLNSSYRYLQIVTTCALVPAGVVFFFSDAIKSIY